MIFAVLYVWSLIALTLCYKTPVFLQLICIAPCREHTSKALEYGTRSQGISTVLPVAYCVHIDTVITCSFTAACRLIFELTRLISVYFVRLGTRLSSRGMDPASRRHW